MREQVIEALFDGDSEVAAQYSALAQAQHGWQEDGAGRLVYICPVCSSHTREAHIIERECCRTMCRAACEQAARSASRAGRARTRSART